ncbi:MAG TPA: hypothetical protein VL175_15435 [Pirellulales bacterium]|jgi:Tol biopolymer transport system component|nr:hypothetical protein [Pirellulales bacterium]
MTTQTDRLFGAALSRRALACAWLLVLAAPDVGLLNAADQPYSIFVMRPDGSEVRKVVHVDGCVDHTSPRWSHDGKQIVFSATPGGFSASAIYVVNADGTELRKIGEHLRADWSPDDKQLAFDRIAANRAFEVYVQGLDGKGETKITDGMSPRWSPDGGSLVVSERSNLFVMDLIAGTRRYLLGEPVVQVFDGYCWSPDGKQLAVVVRPQLGSRRHCLLVNTAEDAQRPRELAVGEMGGYVSFSPDGKQLTYSDSLLIRTIDIDGKSRQRIVPEQKGKNKHPNWSPDGKWIVFSGDRDDL